MTDQPQHAESVREQDTWKTLALRECNRADRAETEVERWRKVAWHLADALRFHEDRRANPTSRGGPALAAYDALTDGSPCPECNGRGVIVDPWRTDEPKPIPCPRCAHIDGSGS